MELKGKRLMKDKQQQSILLLAASEMTPGCCLQHCTPVQTLYCIFICLDAGVSFIVDDKQV